MRESTKEQIIEKLWKATDDKGLGLDRSQFINMLYECLDIIYEEIKDEIEEGIAYG